MDGKILNFTKRKRNCKNKNVPREEQRIKVGLNDEKRGK